MKTTRGIFLIAIAAMFVTTQAQAVLFFARPYDPNLARWITRDPIGERGGINLYGYVRNNPINLFDPLGLSGTLTINAIGGGGSSGLISGALSGTGGGGGHGWITYQPDGGDITSYGTYGNSPLGTGNGLFQNLERSPGYPNPDASLSTHLNDAQEQNLLNLINQYKQQGQNAWGYTHPCTKFANDAWNAGTGQSFDLGTLDLPSTLANDIQNYLNTLNGPTISVSTPPNPYIYVNTPTIFLANQH